MAFGLFLNYEKVAATIIESELSKMTDDNVLVYNDEKSDEINEKSFTDNLIHGSVVSMFIVNLYETALNTILGRRLGCVEEEVLKASFGIKLQLICTIYGIDIAEIKSNNSYAAFQRINKLRNDITHFKSNDLGMGTMILADKTLPMGTSRDSLAEMFTKTYMTEAYNGVLNLIDLICKKCGLYVYKDCQIIDCDGRDDLCEFIVSNNPEEREE